MGVPFEERNISHSVEARADFLESGYDELPTFEIGSTTITRYTGLSQLVEALTAEGYLGE
jgi:hypothetical protein